MLGRNTAQLKRFLGAEYAHPWCTATISCWSDSSRNESRRAERSAGSVVFSCSGFSMDGMTMADWQTFSDRINNVAPSATLAVDSKAKAMKAAGVDVIGFGAGEPDFPTPADVVDAAVKACNDPRNYKYTPTAGLPELREAIAAKVLRDSGYEVTADQVVVTNGGKQAVYESFQILLNDGDEVIIPTPYWTSYPEAVKLAGEPVEVFAGGADRDFEPDIAAIEAARTEHTKAIIVNSPNNPTGAVWKSRNRRRDRRVGRRAPRVGHLRRDLRTPQL